MLAQIAQIVNSFYGLFWGVCQFMVELEIYHSEDMKIPHRVPEGSWCGIGSVSCWLQQELFRLRS